MKKFVELFLGIMTAMGGFVEVGELVFSMNAGAKFGYSLLWVLALGTVGIIVYCEMAGRIAAVKGQPVFNLVRERAGLDAGLVTLAAATGVSVLTCTAEIGGIALVWQLLAGWPYRWTIVVVFLFLLLSIWVLSFQWIERFYGLFGLLMVVFLLTAVYMQPDWGRVAWGLVPQVPRLASTKEYFVFAYFGVALLSSVMMPYETYFYAAGVIEDGWTPSDINLNRIISVVGMLLGSTLAVALVILGAQLFMPRGIEPQLPGAAALGPALVYGKAGVVVALGGMFFAFAGAAVENALSGAYNIAHFLGWPWGKFRPARKAARFTLSWVAILLLSTLVILTGVDPVSVVEYSIVFAVVLLPFTYFPVMVIAGDKDLMGEFANGPLANAVGWFYLAVVTIAALLAIPLLIITGGGQG